LRRETRGRRKVQDLGGRDIIFLVKLANPKRDERKKKKKGVGGQVPKESVMGGFQDEDGLNLQRIWSGG